jgi:hypothetical protein
MESEFPTLVSFLLDFGALLARNNLCPSKRITAGFLCNLTLDGNQSCQDISFVYDFDPSSIPITYTLKQIRATSVQPLIRVLKAMTEETLEHLVVQRGKWGSLSLLLAQPPLPKSAGHLAAISAL